MMESVFVKASGKRCFGKRFVEVPIFSEDSVARLAGRVAGTFPNWDVSAEDITLFVVRKEYAEAVEDGDESMGISTKKLFSGASLFSSSVSNGTFLLAKIPDEGDINTNDIDNLVTITSPLNAVSEVVGPLFENEARLAISQVLREFCPWFDSSSPITTRLEMGFQEDNRQADLFSFCFGDSLVPCLDVPEAGVYIVWPDPSLVVADPPLPAAAIKGDANFSPAADSSRLGPHKYFLGEAYSGMDVRRRREKVHQLETEVEFLMHRFADRSGVSITDPTLIIGAAAVVFPVEKGSQRSSQVKVMLQLVREYAGPHLMRLASAGRLLLVLLSADRIPQTTAQRDTAITLRQMRNEMNNQHRQLSMILNRLCKRINSVSLRSEWALTKQNRL
jgi:hypothetical protein